MCRHENDRAERARSLRERDEAAGARRSGSKPRRRRTGALECGLQSLAGARAPSAWRETIGARGGRAREGRAMEIFGPVLTGLREALSLHEARHRVISENLANVDTPGYRARDIDFGEALRHAFEREGAVGVADGEPAALPEPTIDRSAVAKPDGNSVDVDLEMARLSDNGFRMVALSRIVARKYAGMKQMLSELR
jgi:flagellar basal-body rod protein FlgB